MNADPGFLTPVALLRRFLGVSSIAIGYVVGLLSGTVLPTSFFADSVRIRQYITLPDGAGQDGSYRGTAELYKALGLEDAPPIVVGHIAFLLIIALLLYCRSLRTMAESGSILELILYCMTPLLAGVFLFTYTKELFVVAAIAIFTIGLRRGINAEIAAMAVLIGYGLAVREYWILVVALYVAMRFALARTRAPFFWVSGTVGAFYVSLAVYFDLYLHLPLNYYRTSVVEDLTVNPDSVIVDPFPTSTLLGQVANALYSFATLQIPIPVLLSANQQLAGGLVVLAFWLYFWRHCWSLHREREIAKIFCLLLSYVCVLSIFEPDYGSYLRHLVPVIPLVLFAVVRSSDRMLRISEDSAHASELINRGAL